MCVHVADLQLVRNESKDVDGLYWCVDYPWPMSDRDVSYLYHILYPRCT